MFNGIAAFFLFVAVPVCSLVGLLGLSELFFFFFQQIKQRLPLELILLLCQALAKMLDIQAGDPLIHSSHKQPQRLPCSSVHPHITAKLPASNPAGIRQFHQGMLPIARDPGSFGNHPLCECTPSNPHLRLCRIDDSAGNR